MITNFLNSFIKLTINFIFIFIDIYISTLIFFREKLFYTPNIKKSKYDKKTLTINNQNHYYFEFGDSNATNENTLIISKRCSVKAELKEPILPKFADNEEDELKIQSFSGLKKRLSSISLSSEEKNYWNRL